MHVDLICERDHARIGIGHLRFDPALPALGGLGVFAGATGMATGIETLVGDRPADFLPADVHDELNRRDGPLRHRFLWRCGLCGAEVPARDENLHALGALLLAKRDTLPTQNGLAYLDLDTLRSMLSLV